MLRAFQLVPRGLDADFFSDVYFENKIVSRWEETGLLTLDSSA
jgi:hypothetical protein